MTTDRTDAKLLRLYTDAGDKSADDELFTRYIDFVYTAARRQLADPHLAEDVTQAVFLLFIRRAKSIRPANIPGWLFNAIRYTCLNARKMRPRRAYHEHQAAAATEVHPSMTSTDNELLNQLDDLLGSLRPADRQILLMRYLHSQDIPRLSATIGLS